MLSRQLAPGYSTIGLSLSDQGLRDFLDAHPLKFPVYSLPQSVLNGVRLNATPQTIIASSGEVVEGWKGAYVGETKAMMERFFGIQLQHSDLDNISMVTPHSTEDISALAAQINDVR